MMQGTQPGGKDASGFDLDLARRCAQILGESSAAAQALADRDRRIAAGEDPVVIQANGSWLVVPRSATVEMMGS